MKVTPTMTATMYAVRRAATNEILHGTLANRRTLIPSRLCMRVAIVGSGAVGGYFGAKLAQSGQDVTFIARGAHLSAIREHGLRIRSPKLGDFTVRARAEQETTAVGPVDFAIFAVKAYDNASAIPLIEPLVGGDTVVLTLQNGVDSADDVAAVVGKAHVLGGTTYVATALEEPGLIVQTGVHRSIIFGEVFGQRGTVTPRVQAIADVLGPADIQATAVADGRVPIWDKFVYLAPFSGFTGAARLPIGPLWAQPHVREMFYAAAREVAALAAAEGVADLRQSIRDSDGVHEQHPADHALVAAHRSGDGQAHRGRGAAGRRSAPGGGAGCGDADHQHAVRRAEAVGARRPAEGLTPASFTAKKIATKAQRSRRRTTKAFTVRAASRVRSMTPVYPLELGRISALLRGRGRSGTAGRDAARGVTSEAVWRYAADVLVSRVSPHRSTRHREASPRAGLGSVTFVPLWRSFPRARRSRARDAFREIRSACRLYERNDPTYPSVMRRG